MFSFLIKRLLYGGLVLLGVATIVFFLFNGLGDPVRLTQGQRTDGATVEAIRKELGLDKPLWQQYILYLNDISPISVHESSEENHSKYQYALALPLGRQELVLKKPYLRRSYQSKRLVTEVLTEALPKTLILGITAMLLATFVGIALGIIAALRPFSFWDNSILVTSIIGISQPSYFSGIILALVFGYWLHDYTGLNYTGGLYEMNDYGDEVLHLQNLILPALALGIRPIAIIVQLTRATMLETLSQDFVRTARAKGLSEKTVIIRHALRNALNPVVTALSGWLAAILTGAYFIEIIFDYKGLGFVTITALNNLDMPIAMGSILFTAVLFVCINIATDLLYGWLDPRISLAKA